MHFVKFALALAGYLFINSICPGAAFIAICFLVWTATRN